MGMEALSTAAIIPFLQANGYPILFILMLVEGPLITIVAGFAASFGIFSPYWLVILAALGNFVPDMAYFLMGKYSRRRFVEKFLHRFGANKALIRKMEHGLKRHAGKAIVFIKITPFIPIPGIILAGFLKLPLRKFALISAACNMAMAILLVAVGFYASRAIVSIIKYFGSMQYIIPILALLAASIYLAWKKIYQRLAVGI